MCLGDLFGPVAGAVVDDQGGGGQATDLGRDLVDHVADVVGLVVGRDDDRDPVAEGLAMALGTELLGSDALEHGRELPGVAARDGEGTHRHQEEDEDREDGQAEDATAVALLEG